jgi:lipopolysaccharide heptosyltransferase II
MRRNNIQFLKKIDKFAGTPACFTLGLLDSFLFGRDQTAPAWRRLLVMKLVAVGDLVVCLPMLKALKKSFPEAHIAILVTPRVSQIVQGCPYVDEIISYDIFGREKGPSGLVKIIRRLRKRKFDLVLELDHYYRITTLISYLAGIPKRAGFDLSGQGRRSLYTIRIPYSVDKHEVEVFLEAASLIGADASEKELVEIWVSQEDREFVTEFLKSVAVSEADLLIGIHPGTGQSSVSRRWPPDRFARLADWLVEEHNAKVIFTGAPSEIPLVNEIRRTMKTDPIVSTGRTNLKQLAEIAKRCRIFISGDTGPLHIAAAMKTRVLGLFGPNTPSKWGPYGKGHRVIYKGLPCSPCVKQYLGQVPDCLNPVCITDISVEDVQEVVSEMLQEKNFVGQIAEPNSK